MWIIIMFDLPVVEKSEQKAATAFRNTLLDLGFEMAQFSVYMRFCSSEKEVVTYCRRIEAALPEGGRVNMLALTDKQYERIQTFHGRQKMALQKAPDQYALF